jgi:hypothetical protein
MRIAIASSSVAALFAIASPTAQAATASVYAHVETKYEPNVIGPGNTSCTTNRLALETAPRCQVRLRMTIAAVRLFPGPLRQVRRPTP